MQIGDENVHRVRSLMDEVFGEENFIALNLVHQDDRQPVEFLSGVSDYVAVVPQEQAVVQISASSSAKSTSVETDMRIITGYRCPMAVDVPADYDERARAGLLTDASVYRRSIAVRRHGT